MESLACAETETFRLLERWDEERIIRSYGGWATGESHKWALGLSTSVERLRVLSGLGDAGSVEPGDLCGVVRDSWRKRLG